MSAIADGSPRRVPLLRVALVTLVTLALLAAIFAFVIESNATANAASAQVRPVFDSHLSNFASKDTTSLLRDYVPNATLLWDGTTRGLGGGANGTASISKFYSVFFSKVPSVSVKNSTYAVRASGGGGAVVTGTFLIIGATPQSQTISGQVMVSVSYTQVNGVGWKISSERWNFLSLTLERPLG